MSALRRTVVLDLRGLVAVHAARAVHTALGGVAGVVSAQVSMSGAELELVGDFDEASFAADLRRALEPIGIELISLRIQQDRQLPLLGDLTRE